MGSTQAIRVTRLWHLIAHLPRPTLAWGAKIRRFLNAYQLWKLSDRARVLVTALCLHEAPLAHFDSRWALAHSWLVVHLACVRQTRRVNTLAVHSGLLVSRRAISEGKLEEFNCLLVLKHMPLLQILQHILVSLDQNLRILLSVAKLLVSVPLDPLQEVWHEDGLLLEGLLFEASILLIVTLNLGQFFEFLQLIR